MASGLAHSIVQLVRPDATLYLVADLPQPLPAFKVEVMGARLRLTALASLEQPPDTAAVERCHAAGFGCVRRLAPGRAPLPAALAAAAATLAAADAATERLAHLCWRSRRSLQMPVYTSMLRLCSVSNSGTCGKRSKAGQWGLRVHHLKRE